MTSGLRKDQTIVVLKAFASGIGPVGVTSRASVEQQQRRPGAPHFVADGDAVERCRLFHSSPPA